MVVALWESRAAYLSHSMADASWEKSPTSVSVWKIPQKQNKLIFCLRFSGTIKGWSPAVTILAMNWVAALDLMAQSKINTCHYKESMEHKLESEYFLTQAPSNDCLGASHIVGQWKEKATLLSIRIVGLHYVLFLVLFILMGFLNYFPKILY